MSFSIETMTIEHYDEVLALWKKTENMGLSEADTRANISSYLSRNQNHSFVARDSGKLVGAVLCGHDGRRGYLHHLAVSKTHRRQGLGKALVKECLEALKKIGIEKCHLFVFQNNHDGSNFWEKIDWFDRSDLKIMSKKLWESP